MVDTVRRGREGRIAGVAEAIHQMVLDLDRDVEAVAGAVVVPYTYLEAQNQEKGFGFWCGFSPGLCFPAHWAFAWWGRVILEVQHLVPQWEHTGGL